MGLISKIFGLGYQFEFEGQEYNLPPWTYKIQGLYERYLEKEAVEAAKRMGAHLSPDQARKLLQDVGRDIAAGVYTFGGEEVQLSFACQKHFTQLVYLMLQQEHPTIDRKLVERMVEAELEEMMDRVSAANADPTTPGTVLATAASTAAPPTAAGT
jgi:hypothetical protein